MADTRYAALVPIDSLATQHEALLQRSMRYVSLANGDLIALILGIAAGICVLGSAWVIGRL